MRRIFLCLIYTICLIGSLGTAAAATESYKYGTEVWNAYDPVTHPALNRDTALAACDDQRAGFWHVLGPKLYGVAILDNDRQALCDIRYTVHTPDEQAGEEVTKFCIYTPEEQLLYGFSDTLDEGSCPKADDAISQCPAKAEFVAKGNPIVIADGTKIQYSLDWTSPKDARFSFERYYRSDDVMDNSPVTESFGSVWGSLWDMQLTAQSPDDLIVHRASGTRYVFSGTGQMTPYRSGHNFQLLRNDPSEGGRHKLTNGTGREEFYLSTGAGENRLDEIRWADGYNIHFIRDADGRLEQVEDSQGQVAHFTWEEDLIDEAAFEEVYTTDDVPEGHSVGDLTGEITLFDAVTLAVVTNIEIDVDYDGISFSPEVSLDFTYETPSGDTPETLPENRHPIFFKNKLLVNTVSRTDVHNSSTNTLWNYGYRPRRFGFPSKLATIDDGRLIGENSFDFATFTYAPYHYEISGVEFYDGNPRAIRSEHFGGADAVDFSFNVDGTTTTTNALGKQTTYTNEEIAGRLLPVSVEGIASSNCLGTTRELDYTPGAGEPEGYVYERIERNGSRIIYSRDARGLVLTKTEDADGVAPRITSYTWDATLRLPLTRTTSQMTETFTYSPTGVLLQYSQTDALIGSPDFGATRTWDYGYTTLASGLNVLTSTDGPGLLADGVTDITTYMYDTDGNLTKITDPNGLETEFLTQNNVGQPTLVRGPDGIEWGFTYDIVGRITSSTFDPSGENKTSTYTYDIIGQLTAYTNSLGETWTYKYNKARRLTKITDPMDDEIIYTYDLAGNITRTRARHDGNPLKFSERREYDKLSRLIEITGAHSQRQEFFYDLEDNVIDIIDHKPSISFTTHHTYDALNRLTETMDQSNFTSFTDRNDSGLVTEFTDQRGIDTGFAYNGFGELLTETSMDRGTINYTYNNRGMIDTMTDANSILSTYTYDNAGRLLAKTFPTAPDQDQTFTYDLTTINTNSIGKLSQVTDETGTTSIERGDNGSVTLESRDIGGITYDIEYSYDIEGRMEWMQYPSLRRIYFAYNASNETFGIQTRIEDPAATPYPPLEDVVYNVRYKPSLEPTGRGPLRRLSYGDDYRLIIDMDESYRIIRLRDKNEVTSNLLRDTLIYWTKRDNIKRIDPQIGNTEEFYYYTPREQLNEAIGDWGEIDYTYDAVGNRATQVGPDVVANLMQTDTYTYLAGLGTASNRLQSIAVDGVLDRTFTYDAAGSVTYDDRNGVGYGYTYNAAGRMSSMSIDGVVQAEYEYNVLGQQVVRRLTQAGQVIHSIHDASGNRIAEYDVDEVAGTSTLLREYIWMDGMPVAVVQGGVVYYIRVDHIGRPVFATDSSANIVWEVNYLPFGGVESSSGSNIDLRFPGQWFQLESGLHQNWMRDYDPTTGRYMQADPLGLVDGASVYGYARQNPMRYTDPRGEFGILGAAIGAVSNLGIQIAVNYARYGWGDKLWKCVDIKNVVASGALGFVGVAPLGAVISGKYKVAAGMAAVSAFTKTYLTPMPIRIGDECECDGGKVSGTTGKILDFLDTLQ